MAVVDPGTPACGLTPMAGGASMGVGFLAMSSTARSTTVAMGIGEDAIVVGMTGDARLDVATAETSITAGPEEIDSAAQRVLTTSSSRGAGTLRTPGARVGAMTPSG